MKTYGDVHGELKARFGVARQHRCSCGAPAADWAYQHSAGTQELLEDGRPYSENLDDYAPMCRSCHLKLDYGHGSNRGWKTAWASPSPEFLENNARAARQNGVGARQALAALQADPVASALIRARQSAGARVSTALRRTCETCGKTSNPGGLAMHQKFTGHSGVSAP